MNLRELGVDELFLFDVDVEKSKGLANEVQSAAVETLEQGYAKEPDAVVICAPTSQHLEFALQGTEHNCHLFVEKPLSHSIEGVEELIEEARSRGKTLLVGYNFRFDPLVKQVRAFLNEGQIGRVISARIHSGCYLPWRHPWEDYRLGYGARRELGGGVILDAVHELDLALWLFGQPEIVYCEGGKLSDLEIDVEDFAEIILGYPWSVVSIHLDYVQQPAERTFEIIGTQGQIKADIFKRELRYFDGENRVWDSMQGTGALEEMYKHEMRHFLDCIQGLCMPAVDGRTATQSLMLAEAAKESMQTELPVRLNEFATKRTLQLRHAHA